MNQNHPDVNQLEIAFNCIVTPMSITPAIKKSLIESLRNDFNYDIYSPHNMITIFLHDGILFKKIVEEQNLSLNCMKIPKSIYISPAIFFLFSNHDKKIRQFFPENMSTLDIIKSLHKKSDISLSGKMGVDHTEFKNSDTLFEHLLSKITPKNIEIIRYLDSQDSLYLNKDNTLKTFLAQLKHTQQITDEHFEILDILNKRKVSPNFSGFYYMDERIIQKIIKDNSRFDNQFITKQMINAANTNSEIERLIAVFKEGKLDTNQLIDMFPALPARKKEKLLEIKTQLEKQAISKNIDNLNGNILVPRL